MEGLKIGIIGAGNLGIHLARVFSSFGKHHVMLYARSLHHKDLINELSNVILVGGLSGFSQDIDILFIAVSDDNISAVISTLPLMSALVLHTSGSTSISVFEGHKVLNYGVFYPLQSFTASLDVNYSKIPVLAESCDTRNMIKIKSLADTYFGSVTEMNSEQRRKMHLAAVVVNNFTNHLYRLSYDFLAANNLNFNLLIPLIAETSERLKNDIPLNLQTGPAKRNDESVIKKHLRLLDEHDELRSLYEKLTASIRNT